MFLFCLVLLVPYISVLTSAWFVTLHYMKKRICTTWEHAEMHIPSPTQTHWNRSDTGPMGIWICTVLSANFSARIAVENHWFRSCVWVIWVLYTWSPSTPHRDNTRNVFRWHRQAVITVRRESRHGGPTGNAGSSRPGLLQSSVLQNSGSGWKHITPAGCNDVFCLVAGVIWVNWWLTQTPWDWAETVPIKAAVKSLQSCPPVTPGRQPTQAPRPWFL